MQRKKGPLSFDDLFALWHSCVDPSYARPFVEGDAEGRETGIEVFGQGIAQLTLASEAIDRTTQAMHIMQWSGQTGQPAQGASHARVRLCVRRTTRFTQPISLVAGQVMVAEVISDYGPQGGIQVRTGRRFVLAETVTFGPGQAGPLVAEAVAEFPGYGFNHSPVGSLCVIDQPSAMLSNDRASVVPGVASNRLVTWPEPDVPVPEHVGQYVEFMGGANAGQVRRVVGYEKPNPTASHGGVLILAATCVLRMSSENSFVHGEQIQFDGSGGLARLMTVAGHRVVVEMISGVPESLNSITGMTSEETDMVEAIEQDPAMVPEVGTATWRMLPWHDVLGVSVTNDEQPTGGVAAMLDELGEERSMHRSTGETDATYRKRIWNLPDTVSPNAIRRIGNRILAPYGTTVCLREVGQELFTGLYFDGAPGSGDTDCMCALDLDATMRPEDRWKVLLDYTEMRAFFLLGVPDVAFGEFGFAYDNGVTGFFDATPFLSFYDGAPVQSEVLYRVIHSAVDVAKAAGVGFDLYLEHHGCIA